MAVRMPCLPTTDQVDTVNLAGDRKDALGWSVEAFLWEAPVTNLGSKRAGPRSYHVLLMAAK